MRALIFDPFSGISGDMTLGALLDLGLPVEWLRDFVSDLRIADIGVDAERVQRRGIACTRVALRLPHEHAHRHLSDVVEIIDRTGVDAGVRDRAVRAFTLLAEAEAQVHGTTAERVHFHEVGALDAIVDILGAVAGCAELGFEQFYTRPVTLGRGWTEMAHGNFPVPPPAVLKLLEGVAVRDPAFEGECTTPTGAALIQMFTGGRTPPDTYVLRATGFGAGTRDPQDRPNCLRLIAAEVDGAGADRLAVVQTDVDDLSPEYVPPLMQGLLDAGALDSTVSAVMMKKGRPGWRVEALTPLEHLPEVSAALLQGSTTIGYRWWPVSRAALPREEEVVEWRGQRIRVKRSSLPGGGQRAKPEYEDVARAAAALGIPALAAFRALASEGIASES